MNSLSKLIAILSMVVIPLTAFAEGSPTSDASVHADPASISLKRARDLCSQDMSAEAYGDLANLLQQAETTLLEEKTKVRGNQVEYIADVLEEIRSARFSALSERDSKAAAANLDDAVRVLESRRYTLNDGIDFLSRKHTPSSSVLMESNGAMNLGWFDTPFENLNLPNRKFRQKAWHFISCASRDYIVSFAAVDTGYLSNYFMYLFEMKTGRLVEFTDMSPIFGKAEIAPNSLTGTTTYRSKLIDARIENHYNDGYYLVEFDCRNKAGDRMSGRIKLLTSGEEFVNSREDLKNRIVYTHQNSTYKADGLVDINGTRMRFTPDASFVSMDYTRGLHKYHTEWLWASAAGTSKDGTEIGINLGAPVGGGFLNSSIFWIAGRIYRLATVRMEYTNPYEDWKITSSDGVFNLRFHPIGHREGNVDLGFLVSKYKQPIGYFSGTINAPDGKTYEIENMIGVTEEHIAKW